MVNDRHERRAPKGARARAPHAQPHEELPAPALYPRMRTQSPVSPLWSFCCLNSSSPSLVFLRKGRSATCKLVAWLKQGKPDLHVHSGAALLAALLALQRGRRRGALARRRRVRVGLRWRLPDRLGQKVFRKIQRKIACMPYACPSACTSMHGASA